MPVHDNADDGFVHKFEFLACLLDVGSLRDAGIDDEQGAVSERRNGDDIGRRKERRRVDEDEVREIMQLRPSDQPSIGS